MREAAPSYVRVKDASLVRSILTEGRVYECKGVQDDNYLVAGLWLHRGRFEAATYQDWAAQ
jgi:hypothetical protein